MSSASEEFSSGSEEMSSLDEDQSSMEVLDGLYWICDCDAVDGEGNIILTDPLEHRQRKRCSEAQHHARAAFSSLRSPLLLCFCLPRESSSP
jgi:hypothetical protein